MIKNKLALIKKALTEKYHRIDLSFRFDLDGRTIINTNSKEQLLVINREEQQLNVIDDSFDFNIVYFDNESSIVSDKQDEYQKEINGTIAFYCNINTVSSNNLAEQIASTLKNPPYSAYSIRITKNSALSLKSYWSYDPDKKVQYLYDFYIIQFKLNSTLETI